MRSEKMQSNSGTWSLAGWTAAVVTTATFAKTFVPFYLIGSTAIFAITSALGILLVAVRWRQLCENASRVTSVLIVLALLYGVIIISYWSNSLPLVPATHLWGILIFHAMFMIFGFAAARALKVVLLMLLGAAAIYAFVIVQYTARFGDLMRDGYFHDVFGIGEPTVSITFHQNVGIVLGLAALAALGLASNRIKQLLAIGALPLVLLFMFHISARGALVALVCSLIFLIGAGFWVHSKRLALLSFVTVVVAVTIASGLFYQRALHDNTVDPVAPDAISRTIRELQSEDPGFRVPIWTQTWHQIESEPGLLLFGRGIGMWPVNEGFGAPDWLLRKTEAAKHYPHNVHLEMLYETGIAGLVLFSILTLFPLIVSLRHWHLFLPVEKSAISLYVFDLASSEISGAFAFSYELQFFFALAVGIIALKRKVAAVPCPPSPNEGFDRGHPAQVRFRAVSVTKDHHVNSMSSPTNTPPRRLLYVANEDFAFLLNRLPMARAAREAGFEVHVATNVDKGAEAIEAEGFTLHRIPFQRGGLSPIFAILTILALRRVENKIKPQIVHHSGLQCCVYGSIAALGKKIPIVNAITGLGYIFTSVTWRTRLLKRSLAMLLPWLLNGRQSLVLVQNPDDQADLEKLGVEHERIVLIPGSGVDTDAMQPLPEPEGPITIGFAGRLLTDKGIRAVVAAHGILRNRGHDVNLIIAGNPDPANPASVLLEEAREWGRRPGITWLGHIDDIVSLWQRCHVAVLPSHREGLPMSLLEAAACGRPMVGADAPGCREIVIDDQTGLLVPIENPPALAEAFLRLTSSHELRARYGKAARQIVVDKLSAKIIGNAIVALYDQLLIEHSSRTYQGAGSPTSPIGHPQQAGKNLARHPALRAVSQHNGGLYDGYSGRTCAR